MHFTHFVPTACVICLDGLACRLAIHASLVSGCLIFVCFGVGQCDELFFRSDAEAFLHIRNLEFWIVPLSVGNHHEDCQRLSASRGLEQHQERGLR